MKKTLIRDLVISESQPYAMIYLTTNYNMFGHIKGNRDEDSTNINKITESFKKRHVLESAIITVIDENDTDGKWLKIIDGQHRFTAAVNLGLPISFVIMNEIEINTALTIVELLNTANKEWDVTNFLGSKVELGNEDYIRYDKIFHHYELEHEILFYILNKIDGRKNINHNDFKRGLLELNENDTLILKNILNKIVKYAPIVKDYGKRYYLKSLIDIIFLDGVDIKRLDNIICNENIKLPFTKTKEYALEYIIKHNYNKGIRKNLIYMFSSGKDTKLKIE